MEEMKIPKKMTMEGLRDFAVKNNLYYSHYRNGRVRIYRDRYKYGRDLIGETLVTDYKPIRNYKVMKYAKTHHSQVLKALKGALDREVYEITGKKQILLFVAKGEPDYEIIKNWLEEEE